MQNAKEKMSNMASAVKENTNIYRAKAEEKMEKAVARTEEEKQIAEEQRKAKEAQAKMELHHSKAEHAAEKLEGRHDLNHPAPTHAADGTPLSSATLPTHPLPGHLYRP